MFHGDDDASPKLCAFHAVQVSKICRRFVRVASQDDVAGGGRGEGETGVHGARGVSFSRGGADALD